MSEPRSGHRILLTLLIVAGLGLSMLAGVVAHLRGQATANRRVARAAQADADLARHAALKARADAAERDHRIRILANQIRHMGGVPRAVPVELPARSSSTVYVSVHPTGSAQPAPSPTPSHTPSPTPSASPSPSPSRSSPCPVPTVAPIPCPGR